MPEHAMSARFLGAGEVSKIRADRFQRQANAAEFQRSSDSLEAKCEWLAEVWDHFPDECDDYQAEECDRINRLIEEALAGHKGEIIAFARKRRAELAAKGLGSRRDLVLFGETLPGVRR